MRCIFRINNKTGRILNNYFEYISDEEGFSRRISDPLYEEKITKKDYINSIFNEYEWICMFDVILPDEIEITWGNAENKLHEEYPELLL